MNRKSILVALALASLLAGGVFAHDETAESVEVEGA